MSIKKVVAVVCSIVMLLSLAVPVNASNVLDNNTANLMCDINSDGQINVVDIVALKKYITGEFGNTISEAAADIDASSRLDAIDIRDMRTILLNDDRDFNNDEYWSNEYALTPSQGSVAVKTPPVEKTVTVLTNNYDDTGFAYTTTYDSGETALKINAVTGGRTSVSYSGSAITDLAFNDAVVEQTTGISGSTTYAAHFGFQKNTESAPAACNTLKLYKKSGGSLSLFTPEPNTTYTITLDYKVANADTNATAYYGWPTTLKLVYANNAEGTNWAYSDSNVILNRLAYCGAVTDWTTKTLTFRTGNTVKPLGIIVQSISPWWSNYQNVWADNIIIKETTQDLGEDFSGKMTDTVYSEDFSSVAVNTLPEGWVRDHAYNFLWAANNAQAYKYGSSSVFVKDDKTPKYLYYFNFNGGHILTLPEVNVRNYKYSVTMRSKRSGDYRMTGTLGLATDIDESVSTKENANIFQLDMNSGEAKIYNRKYYSADFGGIDDNKRSFNVKTSTGGALPNDATQEFTMTAYHVDGYTYFYFDGNFVGSIKGSESASGNKIGIYNYGQYSGGTPEIVSASVEELLDMTDYYDYSEQCYAQDFSTTEIGQMPEGMTLLEGEQWGWIGNNPSITNRVESGTGKNVFRFATQNRQAAIALPKFSSGDYCLSMNIKLATAGTFGIATNMEDTDEGCILFTGESDVLKIKRRIIWDRLVNTYDVTDVLGKTINNGDEVNVTVYHIGSTSKFFVNNICVGEMADYYNTAYNRVGIYSCNSDFTIGNIGVYKITPRKRTDAVSIDSAAIRFADVLGRPGAGGIRFTGTLDKTDPVYTDNRSGDYAYSDSSNLKLGFIIASKDMLKGNKLNRCTLGAVDMPVITDISQNASILTFKKGFVNFSSTDCDKTYGVRAYLEVTNASSTETLYSSLIEVCPSKVANDIYQSENEGNQGMIETVYGDSNYFYQSSDYNLTFTLFSDFHYLDGKYAARVADLNTIIDRAYESNSDFILQAGDFCNDFRGSPELTNAYLNNSYGLKAYGIYGNHELESANNNMGYVTTKLTNNPDVVWGTADGTIGDGTIGYYYYKAKGFRVVCVDTNYSYNPTTSQWEHNPTNSYGAPSGNTNDNALGPVQLAWLEDVLTDAANNGIPCIVVGHASFNKGYSSGWSSDADAVTNIYNRVNAINSKTVIMSINGHYHADGPQEIKNGVLFFSVNTATNGYWGSSDTYHYNSSQTYIKDTYDSAGNLISSTTAPLTDLEYAHVTHFFTDPLSTTVHINNLREIVIDGCETTWLYNVVPPESVGVDKYSPRIVAATYNLD